MLSAAGAEQPALCRQTLVLEHLLFPAVPTLLATPTPFSAPLNPILLLDSTGSPH